MVNKIFKHEVCKEVADRVTHGVRADSDYNLFI